MEPRVADAPPSPATLQKLQRKSLFRRQSIQDISLSSERLLLQHELAQLTQVEVSWGAGPLGLTLINENGRTVVKASACDEVNAGDVLLAVNGQLVLWCDYASVMQLLHSVPRPASLIFARSPTQTVVDSESSLLTSDEVYQTLVSLLADTHDHNDASPIASTASAASSHSSLAYCRCPHCSKAADLEALFISSDATLEAATMTSLEDQLDSFVMTKSTDAATMATPSLTGAPSTHPLYLPVQYNVAGYTPERQPILVPHMIVASTPAASVVVPPAATSALTPLPPAPTVVAPVQPLGFGNFIDFVISGFTGGGHTSAPAAKKPDTKTPKAPVPAATGYYKVRWRQGTLGLTLKFVNSRLLVTQVGIPPADLASKFAVGDELVVINGFETARIGYQQSIHFLQTLPKPIRLEFLRASGASEASVSL
ncbi:hypothetical protein SDRG_02685 [Saprolegnia diclina VS20]|uniref:PDZ domain-containing protein n=1 Tax=Saprolegnia diclina (strain VS20) TaxID=1156394 RepID=T0QZA9_SAPDV|nr:hypothetical protein SDRG_02685 [Saprolegnia diclina VS20]EQC40026.1 hypothetical protein SDRG_02685 [Saprolegnia diclina VS20]|eukprot:XP_008606500.1 hypothetical protein SDRG_02685 [Saprolegnia diclina VS20]